MKLVKFWSFLSLLIILSCSENEDIGETNEPNPNLENQYEFSFFGNQGSGLNSFKIIYDIDGNEETEYYNDVNEVTGSKILKINDPSSARIKVIMTNGLNYISDFNIKFKSLETDEIIYQDIQNQPIFTKDALTHKETLENYFNFSTDITSYNWYQINFNQRQIRRFVYDFNQDIGIQQNTRHTLKIEVDNQSVQSYYLNLGIAWGDYVGANNNSQYPSFDQQFFNKWNYGSLENQDGDKVFHFVIPQHITELKVGLGNYANAKTSAKITLMRIDGTTEYEEILVEDNFTQFTWNL